jgi:HNH endonuclease
MSNIYIPIAIQKEVLRLSNGFCEYCLHPEDYSSDFFHFDHIICLNLGGTSVLLNIARCCGRSNGFKRQNIHHFDPLTGQIAPLFNPRKSLWTEHFQWSDDDLLMLGQTDIGRATVDLLQLNRQNLVNLRQLLKNAGLHPPKFSVKMDF